MRDESHELHHEGGVVDYLKAVLGRRSLTGVLESPFTFEREEETWKVDLALTWTESPRESVVSYVNGIPTKDGGTHEQGLRDALVKALRAFIDTHDLSPRGVNISAEDLREGLVCVLSVLVSEPQFQGQTKDRLNNPEIRAAVDGAMRPILEQWLHANMSQGERLVQRAVQAAKAREASRKAAVSVRRKSPTSVASTSRASSRTAQQQPTNASCSSSRATLRGLRQAGSQPAPQAILPLRGKVLNAEQATIAKVLANKELNNVVTALGCGIGDAFRADRLRYRRVILLMDADTDGHHITTLMLRSSTDTCVRLWTAATCTSRSHPSTASTSARNALGPRRWRQGKDPAWIASSRQARDHAIQGLGRDATEDAVRDHARPGQAATAPGDHPRCHAGSPHHQRPAR